MLTVIPTWLNVATIFATNFQVTLACFTERATRGRTRGGGGRRPEIRSLELAPLSASPQGLGRAPPRNGVCAAHRTGGSAAESRRRLVGGPDCGGRSKDRTSFPPVFQNEAQMRKSLRSSGAKWLQFSSVKSQRGSGRPCSSWSMYASPCLQTSQSGYLATAGRGGHGRYYQEVPLSLFHRSAA